MKKILYFLASVLLLLPFARSAEAGPYFSLYAGLTVPHDAEVTNNVTGENGQISFHSGINSGAKVGYWFTSLDAPYIGFQFDANANYLKVKEVITSDGTVAAATSKVNVSSLTANLLFRSPDGDVRPYVGAGIGVFYIDVGPGQKPVPALGVNGNGWCGGVDTALGFQAMVGVDMTITQHLSFFAEYKFNTADFSFDPKTYFPFDMTYRVSQFNGGLTYEF